MADIVTAITRKRAALYARKREIKEQADREIAKIDTELESLDKAVSMLNDAVKDYLCPACEGRGTVRHMDAAGDIDDEPCKVCRGTGVRI